MKWWYENEEEMKSCEHCSHEDCKNIGGTWYCFECPECGVNWEDRKMEFDKSRVYTALNADELRAGDKVITARCMADLKTWVEADAEPNIIELIQDETNTDRFTCKCHGSNKTYDCPLAYLVERAENCTNCGKTECSAHSEHDDFKVAVCSNWIPKAEPKTEQKAEKHYRPFKDTDELIKVWDAKYIYAYGLDRIDRGLDMPHIWVRNKVMKSSVSLIIDFDSDGVMLQKQRPTWVTLFECFEFLDGSPCGVEE